MSEIARILKAVDQGDPQAAARLLPLLYEELRRLAAAKLALEPAGHTLDATALVHEAYLKLGGEQSFATKSAFMRAAAEAMRRVLVDYARAKRSDKRGGNWKRNELADWHKTSQTPEQVLDLSEALDRFAADEPQK